MENKLRFILIGLVGILIISIFINLQISASKQALLEEKENLITENSNLARQLEEAKQRARQLDEKLSMVNRDLDKVVQEKSELQRKVDLLRKEREELIEKLKAKKEEPAVAKEELKPSVPEDSYWAKVLKEKAELEIRLAGLKNELDNTRINYEQIQQEKNLLDLEIKNLTRQNDELKQQIDYNQKIFDNTLKELVLEKNDKTKIQESLKMLKNENTVLRRQLSSLSDRKVDLERKIVELQKENTTLKNKFTQMEALLRNKMQQMEDLRKELELGFPSQKVEEKKEVVELPPIVVKPSASSTEVEALTKPGAFTPGKVLAVNKEHNFVIIDLGQEHGIKPGDTFRVFQADKYIGELEVIQVRKEISACDIKSQTQPIKIGDTVR
ncbi:MAG: hypothetical protein NC912_05210 [Candidatus Omnitrophica bacterium]|nr:hypothetical protein [Candidatus Omnitrophota bacterium]